MPTMSKEVLSASTNGRGIKVAATSTSGTLIHTATTGGSNTDIDEVFIYASNPTSTQRLLTIEFGGATVPDDQIAVQVPAHTTMLVVPGLIMRADLNSGPSVRTMLQLLFTVLLTESILANG